MGLPSKMGWSLWSGILGAATMLFAHKAVNQSWKIVTGEAPPEPNDPDTPASRAFTWALVSGLGLALAQLAVNRFAARRWTAETGRPAPSLKSVNLKL